MSRQESWGQKSLAVVFVDSKNELIWPSIGGWSQTMQSYINLYVENQRHNF